MFAILACVTQGHDLRLVAVAALICAIASVSAFGFFARSVRAQGASRWASAGMTGWVAGCGVWATHFTAELAYQPALKIGYEPWATVASLVIAVLGMGAGFAAAVSRPTRTAALVGGGFTGLSIAAMHFTGMAAVRTQAHILWDWNYVTASLVVAVLGGMVAFEAARLIRGPWARVVPPVLLVLAIVGLHFTAMTAVILQPDPTLAMPHEVIGRGLLAAATVGLASLILGAAASLIWMERLGRRATLSNLAAALDVVPAGLAFFDPAGRLTAFNKAFAGLMTDCGMEAALGQPRSAFIAAAREAGWFGRSAKGAAKRAAQIEVRSSGASELHLPDGRWLRHEAFLTEDGGGVTVFTDISDEKAHAAAMAAARDTAEAANRAKSEFLANISHEIRTPLNGVLGVADLLNQTRLSGGQRKLVGVIRQSGSLLNGLLADLLEMAKVEAGLAELKPTRAAVADLVGTVCDLFAGAANDKGLELRAEIGQGAGEEVICDPVRLRQVLGNLVSNAVKFTPAGEVVVSVARQGEHLRFEVRDTGPGFDAKHKADLFQRFGQGDTSSTRRHGGVGLGLAISAHYVRLMGGELDGENLPGKGAAFGFTLKAPALEPAQPAALAEPAEIEGRGFRVLVVDDNAVNRQVLQLILESVGIEHASAENGREGVEAITAQPFDAVLMDIQMPVMDGFEATRRIRAWEKKTRRSRTPIYIVSANCLQTHVDAGRAAGADGHLNKPISPAVLLQTLEPHVNAALAA